MKRPDKKAFRAANAAKPFAEKVRILEKLRERDKAIWAAKPERIDGTKKRGNG